MSPPRRFDRSDNQLWLWVLLAGVKGLRESDSLERRAQTINKKRQMGKYSRYSRQESNLSRFMQPLSRFEKTFMNPPLEMIRHLCLLLLQVGR